MATAVEEAEPVTTKEFRGHYGEWLLNDEHTPRRWLSVTMPFMEARQWFEVKVYRITAKSDSGEQRAQIDQWVSRLRREMQADNFTPAGWSAGIRAVHLPSLKIDEKKGTASFEVTSNTKMALIDGGHRMAAMSALLKQATEKGDEALVEAIQTCDVTIQIYLDPERLKRDFINLQQGRPVSGAQVRVMKIKNKAVDRKEDQKIWDMALTVATRLNKDNKDSHLFGQVGMDASVTNKIGIDTLTTDSASERACSLFGGCSFAIKYGRDARWLENTYVEVYKAILEHCEADAEDADSPHVLSTGMLLSPLGPFAGKKGGTSLIVGIGTMFAWLKIILGREKGATKDDLVRLARIVDEVFGEETQEGGLDAPRKRRLMGEFTRALMADVVVKPGEEIRPGKYAAQEGIPTIIFETIPPSAFAAKKRAVTLPTDPSLDAASENGAPKKSPKSKKQPPFIQG